MAPDLPYGKLPADQIVPALPKRVWFQCVGEPLGESERGDCSRYLQGLGAEGCTLTAVASWEEAVACSSRSAWYEPWWERERQEERKLYRDASVGRSPDALLLRLANLMQGSAALFLSPASVACARAGVDQAVANSAAGSAAQSLHQYGLASITGQSEEHFFAAKFQLFLAGRWPLCVTRERFYIF